MSYSFIKEIESFLSEDEVNYDKVINQYKIPDDLRVPKNNKKNTINGVDEEEKDGEIVDDSQEKDKEEKEPELSGNLEEEDIIMPDDLDVKNGNEIAEFVKRLNIMRATKSLKDEKVRIKFKEYYKSLSYEERIAFYTFINGINQVCTLSLGENEKGSKPSDYGITINYGKDSKKEESPGKEESLGKEESPGKEENPGKEKRSFSFSKKKEKPSSEIVTVITTEGTQNKQEIFDFLKSING